MIQQDQQVSIHNNCYYEQLNSSLLTLPEELILYIITYLVNDDILSLLLSCHQMRYILSRKESRVVCGYNWKQCRFKRKSIPLKELEQMKLPILYCRIKNDTLLLCDYEMHFVAWDIRSFKKVSSFEITPLICDEDVIVFNGIIVAVNIDKEVIIYDVKTGAKLYSIYSEQVGKMKLFKNYLLLNGFGAIKIYSVYQNTQPELLVSIDCFGQKRMNDANLDDDVIVTGDTSLFIFKTESGNKIAESQLRDGKTNRVLSRLELYENYLITLNISNREKNAVVQLRDKFTGNLLYQLTETRKLYFAPRFFRMYVSPVSKNAVLLFSSAEDEINIWNINNMKQLLRWDIGGRDKYLKLYFDNKKLLVCTNQGIQVIDLASQRVSYEITGCAGDGCWNISCEKSKLIVITDTASIQLFDFSETAF